MPELPEVETVRRGLEPILVGNEFARVEQRRPDLRFPLPTRFGARLEGRKVEALDRRAKYLLARLDDGEVLVMHLGMTGRFAIDKANGTAAAPGRFAHRQVPAPKHEHIVFHLADGAAIRYKAWVCHNPSCGFSIRIDNGEISFGKELRESIK